jgi:hypothetical protein
MINIFVTYRCNLACSYCFARELHASHPQDMAEADFTRLLEWMQHTSLAAAGFIGGEPSLHPALPDMLARTAAADISPVVFTNALFPEELADEFARHAANFVINYNDPELYTPTQHARLHANLERLQQLGARMTFSKNFSRAHLAYDYFLEGLDRYGVRSVRYDISRPSASAANDHYTLPDTREVMSHVVSFVRACESRGVRTGLDCSVKLCDLADEDRRYLERVSMKFTGVCHPSLDVHPDLSASYCLPMHEVSVPDATAFPSRNALMQHFAQAVRSFRLTGVSPDCFDCRDFMLRCQGGCMALKRDSSTQPPEQQDAP